MGLPPAPLVVAAAPTLSGSASAAAATGLTTSSAFSIAGFGVSALGAIGQGRAANASARQQGEIYRREADRERQIGALNAKRIRDQTTANQGTLVALLGDRANTGQGLLIGENLVEEGEFNARLAENNALAAAQSKETDRLQALAAGRNAQTAGLVRAGSTLLKAGKAWSA
jgi:hypothetical protein